MRSSGWVSAAQGDRVRFKTAGCNQSDVEAINGRVGLIQPLTHEQRYLPVMHHGLSGAAAIIIDLLQQYR